MSNSRDIIVAGKTILQTGVYPLAKFQQNGYYCMIEKKYKFTGVNLTANARTQRFYGDPIVSNSVIPTNAPIFLLKKTEPMPIAKNIKVEYHSTSDNFINSWQDNETRYMVSYENLRTIKAGVGNVLRARYMSVSFEWAQQNHFEQITHWQVHGGKFDTAEQAWKHCTQSFPGILYARAYSNDQANSLVEDDIMAEYKYYTLDQSSGNLTLTYEQYQVIKNGNIQERIQLGYDFTLYFKPKQTSGVYEFDRANSSGPHGPVVDTIQYVENEGPYIYILENCPKTILFSQQA